MFPFADLSRRNRKDLSRAAQLRDFTRVANRQPFPLAAADDLYLPRDLWRRNVFGPTRTASFPAPDHYPSSRLDSLLNEQQFPPLHRHPRPTYHATSFTKAARALHDALDKALRYISNLEREFQQDTGFLVVYADPRAIDYLWTAKLDWNGVPVLENADASPPAPEVQYYGKHAARVIEAAEVMRSVDLPLAPGGELSAEDVRTALRKLDVSLGAIVANLEALRGDRTRFAATLREMRSAMGLLGEVGELWMVKKEGRFAEGEVWPGGGN